MKNKPDTPLPPASAPTEDDIRDYAYHLYQQSGCVPGHDLENWLEAKACLEANIPKQHARSRLHLHRHPEEAERIAVIAIAAELDPLQSALLPENEVERFIIVTTS